MAKDDQNTDNRNWAEQNQKNQEQSKETGKDEKEVKNIYGGDTSNYGNATQGGIDPRDAKDGASSITDKDSDDIKSKGREGAGSD